MNETKVRILGLDLGSKRVGVALSDELGWTAQPQGTLEWRGDDRTVEDVMALVRERGVQEVVVGHPLNMDGSAGPASRAAERFAKLLEAAAGVPVHLWDERLSTTAAERVLLEADLSRTKRRKVIDRAAAAFILQGFLDFRARGAPEVEKK